MWPVPATKRDEPTGGYGVMRSSLEDGEENDCRENGRIELGRCKVPGPDYLVTRWNDF